MPLSTGATWPALANRTASAADVNAKLEWLEGHRLPMDNGALTNGAFDIGTSNYKWNNIHLKELNCTNIHFNSVDSGIHIRAWGNVNVSGGTLTSLQSFNISSYVYNSGFPGKYEPVVSYTTVSTSTSYPIRAHTPKSPTAVIRNLDYSAGRLTTTDVTETYIDCGFCFIITGPLVWGN